MSVSSEHSAAMPTASLRLNERVMAFACFVSGAAGLIFEIVWFHRCGLVFGNSVWATSIVLSSFMGGIALGNAAIGRLGARAATLPIYAALEAVVAATGIALKYALPSLAPAV